MSQAPREDFGKNTFKGTSGNLLSLKNGLRFSQLKASTEPFE